MYEMSEKSSVQRCERVRLIIFVVNQADTVIGTPRPATTSKCQQWAQMSCNELRCERFARAFVVKGLCVAVAGHKHEGWLLLLAQGAVTNAAQCIQPVMCSSYANNHACGVNAARDSPALQRGRRMG
jgi:hypothetical protein